MDPNGAMIDYEHYLMRVQTQSGEGLVIPDEVTLHGLNLCSAARARKYIQQDCSGYLAYVVDSRVGRKVTLSEVPIV